MSEQPVYVRFAQEADAAELAAMHMRNRAFFEAFSPGRPDAHYTVAHQRQAIIEMQADREADRRYNFLVCLAEDDRVIGDVQLSFVARGALQSCMIGYCLDQAHNGRAT
ncbi:Acetyltransferase (GNAT) domain-containing protein [Paenibacillus sp. UNC496MF]|nr:Acetyltransferase (GNAT) domain-containing protein [Paenibacillus sp. UNC496MF]